MNTALILSMGNLAAIVKAEGDNLADALALPQQEQEAGDWDQFSPRAWLDSCNQAMAELAFTVVRVQGVLETIERGLTEQSAGVSQSAHPAIARPAS